MLSKSQIDALNLASEGELTRWPGGSWALATEPAVGVARVPTRYAGTKTIRSLVAEGLLAASFNLETWRGPVSLTEAGKTALAGNRQEIEMEARPG